MSSEYGAKQKDSGKGQLTHVILHQGMQRPVSDRTLPRAVSR